MSLKQKGRGFDPHSGRSVVSLSKIGLGSTHFMILIRVNKGVFLHIKGGGAVADPEGVQEIRSNPPLELNYFIFMGNFRKNEAKLRKRTPLSEFEPPVQKSWIRSWGGFTCTKVTFMDPELFRGGGSTTRPVWV